MAVVEGRDQGLDAVCVLELRAVIYSDTLEGVFRKAAEVFLEGRNRGGGSLGRGFKEALI